jgi:hypothetical protein
LRSNLSMSALAAGSISLISIATSSEVLESWVTDGVARASSGARTEADAADAATGSRQEATGLVEVQMRGDAHGDRRRAPMKEQRAAAGRGPHACQSTIADKSDQVLGIPACQVALDTIRLSSHA